MKSFSKIILALMIIASSASAQTFIQTGTVELGGDISLSSQTETFPNYDPIYGYSNLNTETSNQTTFSFNPYFGVMVVRGFELGVQPGIAIINPGAKTNLHLYFAPAYNFNTQSNIYPYVEFLAGYNSEKDNLSTSSGLGLGGDVGMKVAIKGSILLLVKIQYINESYTLKTPAYYYYNYPYGNYYYDPTDYKYSVGTLSFGVGLRVFIGRSSTANAPVEKGK